MRQTIYNIVTYFFDEDTLNEKGQCTFNSFKECRSRRWGFYTDFKEALQCVLENWTDLYECGYYNYVKIQTEEEGIANDSDEFWFKVTYINNKPVVHFIDKPFFEDGSLVQQLKLPD